MGGTRAHIKVSDPSSSLLSRKSDPGEGGHRGPWSKDNVVLFNPM